MRRIRTVLLAALAQLLAAPASAAPPPLVFAVVVGNNDGLGMLPQLNFADDDALRFYQLAVRLAPKQNVALLAELDVDTWRRIQVAGSRPPPFLPPTRKPSCQTTNGFAVPAVRLRAVVDKLAPSSSFDSICQVNLKNPMANLAKKIVETALLNPCN